MRTPSRPGQTHPVSASVCSLGAEHPDRQTGESRRNPRRKRPPLWLIAEATCSDCEEDEPRTESQQRRPRRSRALAHGRRPRAPAQAEQKPRSDGAKHDEPDMAPRRDLRRHARRAGGWMERPAVAIGVSFRFGRISWCRAPAGVWDPARPYGHRLAMSRCPGASQWATMACGFSRSFGRKVVAAGRRTAAATPAPRATWAAIRKAWAIPAAAAGPTKMPPLAAAAMLA